MTSLCPACGWPLVKGWRRGEDDDDVEPSAVCSRPSCDYHY